MAYEETKNVDLIQVLESGVVQVRWSNKVFKNGVEIAKTYERDLLLPGQDVSSQPANVVAVCNASWTPEVVSAYQDFLAKVAAEQQAKMGAQA